MSFLRPRLSHRLDESQPGIPRRVGLHQAPASASPVAIQNALRRSCRSSILQRPVRTIYARGICQVCWRKRRWQNGRTRRSPNLLCGTSPRGCETSEDESAAHSIMCPEHLLTKRPDTFAQTNLSSTFRLQYGDGPYIPHWGGIRPERRVPQNLGERISNIALVRVPRVRRPRHRDTLAKLSLSLL